jgi:hypothetical protein
MNGTSQGPFSRGSAPRADVREGETRLCDIIGKCPDVVRAPLEGGRAKVFFQPIADRRPASAEIALAPAGKAGGFTFPRAYVSLRRVSRLALLAFAGKQFIELLQLLRQCGRRSL